MDLETTLIRHDQGTPYPGSFIDKEYVLHVVRAGTFMYQVQNRVYRISPSSLILIPPNCLHALTRIHYVNMLVIHFYDHSHYLEQLNLNAVVHPGKQLFQQITQLCSLLVPFGTRGQEHVPKKQDARNNNLLFEEQRNQETPRKEIRESRQNKEEMKNRPCNTITTDGLVQALIGYFIASEHARPGESHLFVNWRVIKKAVQYINQEFSRPELCIKEVSSTCGLSYNYFCTQFKTFTNETPLSYLLRTRIEFAKEALFNGSYNVAETAAISGFASSQQFCKVFKRLEQQTPTEWLNRKRQYGANTP